MEQISHTGCLDLGEVRPSLHKLGIPSFIMQLLEDEDHCKVDSPIVQNRFLACDEFSICH